MKILMIIEKAATNKDKYKLNEYYYNSAREGLFDLLNEMMKHDLINVLLLPGYIGWSPKEGSGIFDPIKKLHELDVQYYKMTSDLSVDLNDLEVKLTSLKNKKFAVLIINYFGFIDPRIREIYDAIRKRLGWILEDNAHGFFTNIYSNHPCADATFFSLHKMFPFKEGGSIKIVNDKLKEIKLRGKTLYETNQNPWLFDISKIAFNRKRNYEELDKLVKQEKYSSLFKPLKQSLGDGIIPQTYPIIIKVGNRDKIYELMNQSGYGVVSLYHTLIEPLRTTEHQEAYKLSKQILNLPVHQDVDIERYPEMLELISKFCMETNQAEDERRFY